MIPTEGTQPQISQIAQILDTEFPGKTAPVCSPGPRSALNQRNLCNLWFVSVALSDDLQARQGALQGRLGAREIDAL